MGALDFFFIHDELVVLPIEHLDVGGMSPALAEELRARGRVPEGFVETFDAAFASYFRRAAELHAEAPETWPPPRLQNVCVAVSATRPYTQPFHGSSWVVEACDFDPAIAHPELATYALFHAERLAEVRDMAMTAICNGSYWMRRTDDEIAAFDAAARRSPRADAQVFRRIADAIPVFRALHHVSLRRPPEDAAAMLHVKEAGLLVPPDMAPTLQALVPAFRADASEAMERHLARVASRASAGPEPERALFAWLEAERPNVVIVLDEESLWDPDRPGDTASLARALGGAPPCAVESLHEDLRVVAAHTRAFLSSLREPERLPHPGEGVEQDGGVWVHPTRPAIVFDLAQPGLDPLREPAPPYHRLLLGARTMHEWGHVCEEAGWVAVPDARREEHAVALRGVVRAVEAILEDAPRPFVEQAERDAREAGMAPAALVRDLVLSRMPDYLANLLARRYLSADELHAYVRANVRSHFHEELRPLQLLARYAYEVQYLPLAGVEDPLRYLLRSTWLADYYVGLGLVSEARLRELVAATGRVCACYEVRGEAFVDQQPSLQTK